MNFIHKQITGMGAVVIGIVVAIAGAFTHPGALWGGVALFIGGVGFVGYNFYSLFSQEGIEDATKGVADMAKALEKQLNESDEFPRVTDRKQSIGIKRGADRRSGLFIAIDDDDKD